LELTALNLLQNIFYNPRFSIFLSLMKVTKNLMIIDVHTHIFPEKIVSKAIQGPGVGNYEYHEYGY